MAFDLKEALNLNNKSKKKQGPPPASTAQPTLTMARPNTPQFATTGGPKPAPLQVRTAPMQALHVGTETILPSPNAHTANPNRNDAALQALLHPSLAHQVADDLHQKLTPALAAASQTKELAQQFVARPAAELVGSARMKQASYTPGSRIEKSIFGETPVQNVQKNVGNTYASHPDLPVPARIALTGADAVGQVLNVLPGVGAATKGAKVAAREAAPVVKATTKLIPKQLALDEAGKLQLPNFGKTATTVKDTLSMTPRATLQDQRALRDYSDHLAGVNPASGDELYNTINAAKAAAAKHGVDITSGSSAARLENTNKILDTIGQKNKGIVQGGYAKLPNSKQTLYHGTAQGGEFNPAKTGSGNRGQAIYLTDNAEAAKYHSYLNDQRAQNTALRSNPDLSVQPTARLGSVSKVALAKDAKIAQLDHPPTPNELAQLKQQGYHGASFAEDLYKSAEDIPHNLVDASKINGAKTTVLFDGSKVTKSETGSHAPTIASKAADAAKKMVNDDPLAALKQEALKYKSADEYLNSFEKRYHQTSPEAAASIEKSGFKVDNRTSGANDILPVGVNTKAGLNDLGLGDADTHMQVHFAKDANVPKFANRDALEKYFYDHKDGGKFREAVNTSKQVDATYQKAVDDVGKQIDARYKELYDKGIKAKDDPEFQALHEKEDAILEEWSKKYNEHQQVAQAESTRIAKQEGWDGVHMDADVGSFGRTTDNTIILDSSKVKTKQQLTDLYNQAHAGAKPKKSLLTPLNSDGGIKPGGKNVFATGDAATPTPHPTYGTLDDFKKNYSMGLGEVNRLKRNADGTEYWGKDQQLSKQIKGNGIYSTEDLYKHLTGETAPAKLPTSQLSGAATPTTRLVRPKETVVGQSGSSTKSTPNGKVIGQNTDGSPIYQPGYAESTQKTKFTSTVKGSPEFSKETKAKVDTSYTADTIDAAMGRAKASMKQNGVKKTLDQTLSELNTRRGTASRDTLAQAIELAKHHDSLGTEAGHNTAATLLNLASEHGSALGQGTQILAAIARRSPAGLRNKAINDLKEAGIDITKPENAHILKEIQGHITTIRNMKDGPAKDLAVAAFQKAVAKHLPQSTIDRGISIWKAGLLSGVKTQQGNALSNATFGALKKISDLPSSAADEAMSFVTGKRTKTMTTRGIASGTAEGGKQGAFTMKTGIDARSAGDKYEQHAEINFGNKILQNVLAKPANLVFRGMNAADQPFWYASLKNSLYDQAKADGITRDLSGKALRKHVDELVQNPTERMADTAVKEANKSTLNYDTMGSRAIQMAHKGIDLTPGVTPAGARAAHAVLNVIAPFVRVPSAFLSRTVDFTPLGVGKEIFHQVASGKFDQRDLAQAIGEGITGTGVIALGVNLSQHNLLSGDYPKNDPKEAQRWKAEGITPNSVKLGGKWVSLNYMGPAGLLFRAGQKINDAKGDGAASQAGQAVASLGQGLLGQSFLQGFTGFSDAINDPNRNLKSFVNSQAASVVPAISNDVANVTDSKQRQADTVSESIKNKIPGLREQNKVKQDVYGNPLSQPSGQLGTLNGLKPSNSLTDRNPVIAEVSRLHRVNPNDSNLQATPTAVDKSITVEGKQVPLTTNQRYDLQKQIGQNTQTQWGKLIQTPEYKAMNDTEKAAALGNIRTLATEDVTRKYVVANNLGTYTKDESKKAVALAQGESVADLASSKATGGSSSSDNSAYYKSPDAEYKALVAKDKKAKYSSDAQRIKAQTSLAKAKVGSGFDKKIRDLYGLSADELYSYVSTNPDGNAIVDKVLAYGDALADAGIQKNKLRDKYGRVTLKAKGGTSTAARSSSGGVRKASNTKFAASLSKMNSANTRNDKALRSLISNARISTSKSRSAKVAGVQLKKQTAKRTNKVTRKVMV